MKYYLILKDEGEYIKKGGIVNEIDDETLNLGNLGRFDKESALNWGLVKEVKIKIIED
jgi:hypothetical protein